MEELKIQINETKMSAQNNSQNNNFANFSEFIEDFSKNQEFIDKFTEIIGITPDEASKLSFDESMDLMFDGTIDSLMTQRALDDARDKCYEKHNLIQESKADVTRRLLALPRRTQLYFAFRSAEFQDSDAAARQHKFNSTRNYLLSKGLANSYFNCPICDKTHKLSDGRLGEQELAIHQEIALKTLVSTF